MKGIHLEVVLAAAYTVFLVLVAAVLEGLARYTHRQAQGYPKRGFRYHRHLDVWECPQGEHLYRHETDEEQQWVRYRAKAQRCNSCALKALCTDSDHGREIVHSTQSWLDTEIGRFHRGLSLALLGLSLLITGAVWTRHHQARETAVLALAFGVLLATAIAFSYGYWKNAWKQRTSSRDRASSPVVRSRLG